MFDYDDVLLFIFSLVLFFAGLFFFLFIITLNELPNKIKDTNCIYYEKQIYCLQEGEENVHE